MTKKTSSSTFSRIIKDMWSDKLDDIRRLVESDEFDPNETSEFHTPLVSSLVCVLTGVDRIHINDDIKDLFKKIVNNPKFDPNKVDAAGMTPLMCIAEVPKFNWLGEEILKRPNVNMGLKDCLGSTALDIANRKKNYVLAEVIRRYKDNAIVEAIEVHKGLPRKRNITVKKVQVDINPTFIKTLDISYPRNQRDELYHPYRILYNFLAGNYDAAVAGATDIKFNPNELDRWGEPVLCSLIYLAMDSMCKYDEEGLKQLAIAIKSHPLFDVNTIDADGNTVLMTSMSFSRLQWLTKELFMLPEVTLDFHNNMGKNTYKIAKETGQEDFYNELVGMDVGKMERALEGVY